MSQIVILEIYCDDVSPDELRRYINSAISQRQHFGEVNELNSPLDNAAFCVQQVCAQGGIYQAGGDFSLNPKKRNY